MPRQLFRACLTCLPLWLLRAVVEPGLTSDALSCPVTFNDVLAEVAVPESLTVAARSSPIRGEPMVSEGEIASATTRTRRPSIEDFAMDSSVTAASRARPSRGATPVSEDATSATAATRTWRPNSTCRPYPGKRVVLVTVNEPYLTVFENWLAHAARHLGNSDQLVVAAESKSIVGPLRQMSSRGPRSFEVSLQTELKYKSANEKSLVDFRSPLWSSVVTHRPLQILKYVEQGCQVFYSDVDAVWVKSVFPAVDKHDGMVDMLMSDDHSDWQQATGKSTYLCSCLLYIEPTEASKSFLRDWNASCAGKNNDQKAFNHVIRIAQVKYKILSQSQFPSRALLDDRIIKKREGRLEDVVVIHANYMSGIRNKIAYLKKMGRWREPRRP